jgi:SAM-dependent methyltransferase
MPFIRGDSVLDVGCVSRYGKPDWVHGLLMESFPDVVGIDIDADAVKLLRERGFEVELANAEDFELHRQFDTIFAGELIEHLDNVHGFLASSRRHLRPGGRLVLTTPNVFYVGAFVYRWGGHGNVHPEHTCWYCEDTLRQVIERNGYTKVEISFTGHVSPTAMRKAASSAARRVLPPRLSLDILIAVASA